MGSKKLKLADEKQDRISDLPDCLIHHILSFLPSTKQAIQTEILSKRWRNQWTRVPVLIFNPDSKSHKSHVDFINNTLILHDCSVIKKFHLHLDLFKLKQDPQIDSKISFATSKNVEDLDLKVSMDGFYVLPQLLFKKASLVRLKIDGCSLVPNGNISWRFLTLLIIRDCKLTEQTLADILSGCPLLESLELTSSLVFDRIVIASQSLKRLVLSSFTASQIEISCLKLEKLSLDYIKTNLSVLCARVIKGLQSGRSLPELVPIIQSIFSTLPQILSGCPLLESLELVRCSKFDESDRCSEFDRIVIASKSLKKLVLSDFTSSISVLEISCPKLQEFSLGSINTKDPKLFAQAIESVLRCSSSLESMSIQKVYPVDKLVIASKSLKRLVVGNISSFFDIRISCPKLEILKLADSLNVKTAKLLNLPSSLCATIDFYQSNALRTRKSLIEDILQQLQHVNELKIGSWFIEVLSTITVGGEFSGPLNIKCLTLNSPSIKSHHSGIARMLRISPVIDKLVINVPSIYRKVLHMPGNNDWISNATVFECLVSHLKTLTIIAYGFKDARRQHMLNLVQFLLNNARVLEKMVIIVEDDGTGLPSEVSQELLSLSRCSQDAIVEVLYSKEIEKFL